EASAACPMPVEQRAALCRGALERLPDAVSGQGGHDATFRAARTICVDYLLSGTPEAEELLGWFNRAKCRPEGTEGELGPKLDDAARAPPAEGWSLGGGLLSDAAKLPFVSPRRIAVEFPGRWVCWQGTLYRYDGTRYVPMRDAAAEALIRSHTNEWFD